MAESFFQQVYNIVRIIPPGKVTTYGTIAKMLGRPGSARYVGFALGKAPSGLPCHRVVNQSGALAGTDIFGSQDFQRHLLSKEGITFSESGHIRMKEHLWKGTNDFSTNRS